MNKKNIFLSLLATVAILPLATLATDGSQVTVEGIIQAAVQTAWYIADGVVVILWIVTGILFLIAQGEPAKLNAAKGALFAAVIGTAVIIVAASAVYLVGSAFGLPIT